MRTFDHVQAKPLTWLEWVDGIFPIDLSLLVSAAGAGKGTLVAKVASDVTQGRDCRGVPIPSGTVITVSPEDDPETCTIHRLRASDARLDRVVDMTYLGDDNHMFTVGQSQQDIKDGKHDDLPALEHEIKRINADPERANVRMVTLDPLNQIAGCKLRDNQTVRNQVMLPLRSIAKRYNVAIILVHHFNKSGSVAGSAAVVEAARHVLEVHRDASRRLLRVRKSNIANDEIAGLDYYITGESPANTIEVAGHDRPLTDEQRAQASTMYANLRKIIGGQLD